MANIKNYISLSDTAKAIKEIYLNPEQFYNAYLGVLDSEKNAFISHILINNIPFAFKAKPLLFEQLIQYLADNLKISPGDIKLIGSGKTGFSISSPPNYGKIFSEKSDLDFTLVNENVFNNLKDEFHSWAIQFEDGKLKPKHTTEEKHWKDNLEICPKTLNRGFIDTNKIPSHYQFRFTQLINNSLSLIKRNLESVHNISVKNVSIRVYQNWNSFSKVLKFNTEDVLKKIL